MNLETFFKKNSKYVILVFVVLFLLKTVQSCNRNMTIKKLTKNNIELSDSLNTEHDVEKAELNKQLLIAKDSIKELNYEVKLAKAGESAAQDKADAVQSTAEKIRENTTVKIETNPKKNNHQIDSLDY